MGIEIIHNPAKSRFESVVEGRLSILEYYLNGKRIALNHTEVPPELRGRGIASQLARAALDYARDNHLEVKPYCTFVAAFIKRHPEYAGLIAPG